MITAKQENFAQAVASGMKAFYVYELIDPRDGYVFYIGKGKGCRIRQHARNARAGRVDNVEKYRRITAIHSAGMQVIEKIVSWHETGGQALSAERVAIAAVRAGLTNIIGGITTNEEKVSEEAKILLTKLAPVSWLKSHGKPEMRKVIEAMFGSFEAYDDFLRGALNKLIVPSKVGESREVEYG